MYLIILYNNLKMFKEKTSKKKLNIDNKDTSTLDAMHNKMIKDFEETATLKRSYEESYLNYTSINDILLNQIDYFKKNNDKDAVCNLCTSNISVRENIIDIKNKLNELEKYDEIEYYKNTSEILFQYYDTVEKQSLIQKNHYIPCQYLDYKAKKSEAKKRRYMCNTVNVLDALNKTEVEKPVPVVVDADNSFIDKSSLVDQYLSIINKKHIKTIYQDEIEICKMCKNSMICLQHDAIMICDLCGYQELLLVEQNRPILKQNTKDTSHFSYKRINHFREWCNQVQGKESTDIPDEVFEKILNEIKKEKITDTKSITYTKMRDILKRLRINKYYEHINYIINRINGIPTPQFSPELEDKLCNMFKNIQAPFLKHCPKDRKNFLSYSYVLYKFFQILGLNEYLKFFPLLKSREKLYVQDQIWRKICQELNYEIIPSL